MGTYPILILLIGGIVLTIGDIVMKSWTLSNQMSTYLIGLTAYIIAMHLLTHSYKYKSMATASSLLVVFNIVSLLIVSALYYKEPISTAHLVGIGLAIAGVLVMELS